MNDKEGVVYVATGEDLVQEAVASADSLRTHMPDVDISIVTDVEYIPEVFDNKIMVANSETGAGNKVRNMRKTPYKKSSILIQIYILMGISPKFSSFLISSTSPPVTILLWTSLASRSM